MRKWLWGFGAVLLAGAGWLGWHCYQYPDSIVGRCAQEACVLTLRCNPLLALKGQLVQIGLAGSDRNLGGTTVAEDLLADPIPVVPGAADADGQRLAAWIDLPGGNPPAGSAPIVIPEEEATQASELLLAIRAEEAPLAEGEEQQASGPLCPRQMPYCNDDETPSGRMPRADDETNAIQTSWLEFFFGSGLDRATGCEEEAEPPLNQPADQKSDSPTPSHCPAMGASSGCPYYHGPCTSPSPAMAPPAECEEQEAGSKATPQTRARQPHLPPSFRKALFEDTDLTEPTVDTMEYRSSDRTFGDFGRNPY